MAVIHPDDLPPGDTRPIYDRAHMPGGPWQRYRSRTVIDAVRVAGQFLVRRDDGMLVEREESWVAVDTATGDPLLISPQVFADQYEPEAGS